LLAYCARLHLQQTESDAAAAVTPANDDNGDDRIAGVAAANGTDR